jgi:stage V sporulation protein AC
MAKTLKTTKTEYGELVEQKSPKANILKNCFNAFLVGGIICLIGQIIANIYINLGSTADDAGTLSSLTLILIGAILTGADIYDSISEFAGAGSIIPITGFANSVVASAIEFKKEGYVLGLGTKMLAIAGPAIIYGTIGSVVYGIIYYFINSNI